MIHDAALPRHNCLLFVRAVLELYKHAAHSAVILDWTDAPARSIMQRSCDTSDIPVSN
jgi:hypothetical protein